MFHGPCTKDTWEGSAVTEPLNTEALLRAFRFFSKVEIGASDECWPWKSSKGERGYGRFWMDGRYRPAAQVAWELHNAQPFPGGKEACHSCDTPGCVNPWHIFVGTHQENMLDHANKGLHHEARREFCANGHEFTPENTRMYGSTRRCRTCQRAFDASYRERKRART
jgi:hypothetical protein